MVWKRSLNPLCYDKHSSTIYILQYYKEYYKVTVYLKSNFPTSFNCTAQARQIDRAIVSLGRGLLRTFTI